jgi:hypothetical protein
MTFEGSGNIIFQQITYLFEKCKQCISKAVPFAEHNFGPFEHIFFVVVLFDSQSKTLFTVLFSFFMLVALVFHLLFRYFNLLRY